MTLTYNKSPLYYRNANTLLITATFNEDITPTPPTITIGGGNLGGVAVSTITMSGTTSPRM